MYYTARAIKIFTVASIILFIIFVLLSSKAILLFLPGDITFEDIDLAQGMCANLLSGTIVAVIIYAISYKEQKDKLVDSYLKNVIHIIKYSNIKNEALKSIKNIASSSDAYNMVNSQDFLASVGTLETFTKLSRERAFSFAENKDNFYPVIQTKTNMMHQSAFQEIDNAFFNSPNSIYYTIHYTIQLIENKIKVEMMKGASQSTSSNGDSKEAENAGILKKELISIIDLHKPSLEQSVEELSKLGYELSELAGKTKQWNSFLSAPTA